MADVGNVKMGIYVNVYAYNMETGIGSFTPLFPHLSLFHTSHIVLHYSRRVEDILIIAVVKRFGMTACINDSGRIIYAGKCRAVVKVVQLFAMRQAGGVGVVVPACLRGCGGYELLFAIAMEAAGLLVDGDGAKAEINHFSKIGKEKDKEGEYGEGSFHALP